VPGVSFVDRQTMGPYRWWRHEHRFEEAAGGTRVIDRVHYAPRAGWGSGWFVRRSLERIFAYRREAMQTIFSRRQT
jgi:ligand-binding SRPBCC domain-containing protein